MGLTKGQRHHQTFKNDNVCDTASLFKLTCYNLDNIHLSVLKCDRENNGFGRGKATVICTVVLRWSIYRIYFFVFSYVFSVFFFPLF